MDQEDERERSLGPTLARTNAPTEVVTERSNGESGEHKHTGMLELARAASGNDFVLRDDGLGEEPDLVIAHMSIYGNKH